MYLVVVDGAEAFRSESLSQAAAFRDGYEAGELVEVLPPVLLSLSHAEPAENHQFAGTPVKNSVCLLSVGDE
jgi:hypothetical protein